MGVWLEKKVKELINVEIIRNNLEPTEPCDQ
jgi:hypothetical protein